MGSKPSTQAGADEEGRTFITPPPSPSPTKFPPPRPPVQTTEGGEPRTRFQRLDQWLMEHHFAIAITNESKDEMTEQEAKAFVNATFVVPRDDVLQLQKMKEDLKLQAGLVPGLQADVVRLREVEKKYRITEAIPKPASLITDASLDQIPVPPKKEGSDEYISYQEQMIALTKKAKEVAEQMLYKTEISLAQTEAERKEALEENAKLQQEQKQANEEINALRRENEKLQAEVTDLRCRPVTPAPVVAPEAPRIAPSDVSMQSSTHTSPASVGQQRAETDSIGAGAEDLLRDTMNRNIEIFGEKDFRSLQSKWDLGELLFKLGSVEESEVLYNSVLDILRSVLAERQELPDEAEDSAMYVALAMTTLSSLASVFVAQGKTEEAKKIFNEALMGHSNSGNNAGVADCALNLAQLYETEDQMANAMLNYEEAASKFMMTFGSTHAGTREAIAGAKRTRSAALNISSSEPKLLGHVSQSARECSSESLRPSSEHNSPGIGVPTTTAAWGPSG
eukprot:CAMPEP_0197867470 /NCGR_PEP_ID=MMETSP1438-20131217/44773_1 /TAXON_ID=1461541 /ORGANISM="Pterosperma sp., Strain CCMP1384" /LENGTH=507 /DNA_ID=CAMNT_0043486121 /DNA_START=649 /DNA_END=2172 /DNA_ORIENTATION=+